jgi:hypothetical protein
MGAAMSIDPVELAIALAALGWPQKVGTLANKNVAQTIGNTVTMQNVANFTIPPIPPSGAVRITCNFSMNNSTNAKTAQLILGGTSIVLDSRANVGGLQISALVRNRGVQNVQQTVWQSFRDSGAIAGGVVPSTLDFTQPQVLGFWCAPTVANTTDIITMEGYTVEELFP